jgi:hypothetical protein
VRGIATRFVIVDFYTLHPKLKAMFLCQRVDADQISSSSEPKEIVGFA